MCTIGRARRAEKRDMAAAAAAAADNSVLVPADFRYTDTVSRRATTIRVLRRLPAAARRLTTVAAAEAAAAAAAPEPLCGPLPATPDAAAAAGPYYCAADVLTALRYEKGGGDRGRIEKAIDPAYGVAAHTAKRRASGAGGRALYFYDAYALERVLAHTIGRHTAETQRFMAELRRVGAWAPCSAGDAALAPPLARNVSREGRWLGAVHEAVAAAGYSPALQYPFFHAEDGQPNGSGGAGRRYAIDMYFAEERVAVECDEHGHADREAGAERTRQAVLERELRCVFVRFDPDAPDFSIYATIGRVFAALAAGRAAADLSDVAAVTISTSASSTEARGAARVRRPAALAAERAIARLADTEGEESDGDDVAAASASHSSPSGGESY